MPVTAALVGTVGPHSSGWLETLRLSPCVERMIVCDVDTAVDPVADVDAQLGSLDELLQISDIDMAILSLRNDQYPEAGRKILERGIPTIIEKPAARTAAEIATLNDIATAANTIWATGFLNRMLPLALELKGLIQAGVLGRIVSAEEWLPVRCNSAIRTAGCFPKTRQEAEFFTGWPFTRSTCFAT